MTSAVTCKDYCFWTDWNTNNGNWQQIQVYNDIHVLQYETQQDAQLSQRDRAAGCITVLAKSGRLERVASFWNQRSLKSTGLKICAKFCTFHPVKNWGGVGKMSKSEFQVSLGTDLWYTFGAGLLHRRSRWKFYIFWHTAPLWSQSASKATAVKNSGQIFHLLTPV